MNDKRPLDDQEPWVIGQHARRARAQKKPNPLKPKASHTDTLADAFKAATDFMLEFSAQYNGSAGFRDMVQSTLQNSEQAPDYMNVREPQDASAKAAFVELVKGYKPVIERLGTPACTLDSLTIGKLQKLYQDFTDAYDHSIGGDWRGC